MTLTTQQYRHEQDIIQNWIDERCDVVQPEEGFTYAATLFREYSNWASDSREWDMKKRQFMQKLQEKGFRKERQTMGMAFSGLILKTEVRHMDGTKSYK